MIFFFLLDQLNWWEAVTDLQLFWSSTVTQSASVSREKPKTKRHTEKPIFEWYLRRCDNEIFFRCLLLFIGRVLLTWTDFSQRQTRSYSESSYEWELNYIMSWCFSFLFFFILTLFSCLALVNACADMSNVFICDCATILCFLASVLFALAHDHFCVFFI